MPGRRRKFGDLDHRANAEQRSRASPHGQPPHPIIPAGWILLRARRLPPLPPATTWLQQLTSPRPCPAGSLRAPCYVPVVHVGSDSDFDSCCGCGSVVSDPRVVPALRCGCGDGPSPGSYSYFYSCCAGRSAAPPSPGRLPCRGWGGGLRGLQRVGGEGGSQGLQEVERLQWVKLPCQGVSGPQENGFISPNFWPYPTRFENPTP